MLFTSSRGGSDRHLARNTVPNETVRQVHSDAHTRRRSKNDPLLHRISRAVTEWSVFRKLPTCQNDSTRIKYSFRRIPMEVQRGSLCLKENSRLQKKHHPPTSTEEPGQTQGVHRYTRSRKKWHSGCELLRYKNCTVVRGKEPSKKCSSKASFHTTAFQISRATSHQNISSQVLQKCWMKRQKESASLLPYPSPKHTVENNRSLNSVTPQA